MRTNTLKTIWQSGGSAVGLWLTLPDTMAAEEIGALGADYTVIDMQHGVIDYSEARLMLQAMQRSSAVPVVRVPWNEPGIIGKVLDAGAMGVVIPMVNSVAEAEQAVAACFYAPKGTRSHGPVRAQVALGDDYSSTANDEILCIPMIETVQAVEQIDEILAVSGIDAVYVGPADLSRTLGLSPRADHTDATFVEALETVLASCAKAGVPAGFHANPTLAPTRLSQGFKMVTATSDLLGLKAGLGAALAAARAGASAADSESIY